MFAHDGTILIIEVPSLEKMGASTRFIDYFHIAHPWSFSKSSFSSLLSRFPLKIIYMDNVITCISIYSTSSKISKQKTFPFPFAYTIALLVLGVVKDNLRVLNKSDRLMYSLKRAKDYLFKRLLSN